MVCLGRPPVAGIAVGLGLGGVCRGLCGVLGGFCGGGGLFVLLGDVGGLYAVGAVSLSRCVGRGLGLCAQRPVFFAHVVAADFVPYARVLGDDAVAYAGDYALNL